MKEGARPHQVFIAGGTGYMGQRLIPELLRRGHGVRALVREGSQSKLPVGCTPVIGNALDKGSYVAQVQPSDTFVQLTGVAHPGPSKAAQFRSIDLVAGRGAIAAAKEIGVAHFVYLSVAHPAPAMQAYIEVRSECEAFIGSTGLDATILILRPWYVLGPGHRWPYFLIPAYKIAELIPSLRAGALRLGLVTLRQMIGALVWAVEHPSKGITVVGVPDIRRLSSPR